MPSERLDAVVALACEFTPDLMDIGQETQQRMDVAIDLVEREDLPLVVSGNYPFRWHTAPPRSLAQLMKSYAVEQGLPEPMVIVEDSSLDTIGNALFTKVEVTSPRGWNQIAVVTSNSHVPRSKHIFEHVMGPNCHIDVIGSGAAEEARRFQQLSELVGSVLMHAVLAGTEPGDTAAIQTRLFKIIPGYSEVPTLSRLLTVASGLVTK